MKISGPGSKLPSDAAGAPEGAGAPDGRFAEKLEKGAGAAPAAEAPGAGLVGDISADLRAGRITREVAIDRVVDRVLDRQIPADAPAALREKVGAALRQALEDDPHLAEKLRELA